MTAHSARVGSDEVESLLSGRTRDIRLGPQLTRAFRERSFKQTSKIIRAWMVWVILLDAMAITSNLILLPQTAALAMLAPALLIPPSAAFVYLVWSRRTVSAVLNVALVFGMFMILLAVALMGYFAGGEFQERYLTIMLFVAVTAVIIFNVPSWTTLTIAGTGLALYLVFQLSNPAISTESAISAFLFFASGVASTVAARRTMSILAHRTFLLELRDARRVAELAGANLRLEHLSRTDPLTGLSNRRHIEAVLTELFSPQRSERGPLAILMCDIDCFKALNDLRGHLEGDAALARVAALLTASVSPDRDFVSRFGGEEFLLVLTDVTAEQALAKGEEVRQRIRSAGLVNPGSPQGGVITVSVGVAAETDFPEATARELLHASDIALYAAKARGRDRVERASPKSARLNLAG